jgi:hypothetical protein
MNPPSPATIVWQLATSGGEHVDVTLLVHAVPGGGNLDFLFTEGSPELDFAAWSAAVNDPTFTRSIMDFGGFVKEQPFANQFAPNFTLGQVYLRIEGYNSHSFPMTPKYIQAALGELPIVPEPAEWWQALFVLMAHTIARRRCEYH